MISKCTTGWPMLLPSAPTFGASTTLVGAGATFSTSVLGVVLSELAQQLAGERLAPPLLDAAG
ncbi:hypothetical protein [Prauserella flavalba]|uniref:hypothetical protein n=1 Tax=Prauserella flavalba TaxID=1477506 RepID=UPI0036EF7D5C